MIFISLISLKLSIDKANAIFLAKPQIINTLCYVSLCSNQKNNVPYIYESKFISNSNKLKILGVTISQSVSLCSRALSCVTFCLNFGQLDII